MWVCVCDVCSYEALVDGLRQGPSSFTRLVYHSQMAYEFVTSSGAVRAARFRLVLHSTDDVSSNESGQLDVSQQDDVALCGRRREDARRVDCLSQEFIEQLQKDEPVTYQLQIQLNSRTDNPSVWHPQLVLYAYQWTNFSIINL